MHTLFQHGSAIVSTCTCPDCEGSLPSADIDFAAGTALCRECGSTHRISELVASGRCFSFDPSHPPKGVSFLQDADGIRVSATTRSAELWFLAPFVCVWSLGFSRMSGTQIGKGVFDLSSPLFGIPIVALILGTLVFCGRVTVAWKGDECIVYSGVGPFGWTRKFRWSSVQKIMEDDSAYRARYRVIRMDVLNGARLRSIKFGALLSRERRQCVLCALRSPGGMHQ
jgi:hypothetical protein